MAATAHVLHVLKSHLNVCGALSAGLLREQRHNGLGCYRALQLRCDGNVFDSFQTLGTNDVLHAPWPVGSFFFFFPFQSVC